MKNEISLNKENTISNHKANHNNIFPPDKKDSLNRSLIITNNKNSKVFFEEKKGKKTDLSYTLKSAEKKFNLGINQKNNSKRKDRELNDLIQKKESYQTLSQQLETNTLSNRISISNQHDFNHSFNMTNDNQNNINVNLIINNNIHLKNNKCGPNDEQKNQNDTFIEKSIVDENPFGDNDSSSNPDDTKNQEGMYSISNIDIHNNDLVIEKEVLHSEKSLIDETGHTGNDINYKVYNREKYLKIFAIVICFVLAAVVSYIFYFASKL